MYTARRSCAKEELVHGRTSLNYANKLSNMPPAKGSSVKH